jgi:hypothetical protein
LISAWNGERRRLWGRLPSLWLLRALKGSESEESGKESGRAFILQRSYRQKMADNPVGIEVSMQ